MIPGFIILGSVVSNSILQVSTTSGLIFLTALDSNSPISEDVTLGLVTVWSDDPGWVIPYVVSYGVTIDTPYVVECDLYVYVYLICVTHGVKLAFYMNNENDLPWLIN